MKRQFAIFLAILVLVSTWGLIYGSQVVADLTIFYPVSVDVPGTKIVLRPSNLATSPSAAHAEYLLDVQQSQDVVARRLNQLNLPAYYTVAVQGKQLEVVLPKHKNTPYVISVITQVGEIEFIDGGGQSPPIGQIVTTGARSIYVEGIYQTLFGGQEIITIVPPDADSGDIFYQIELQPVAAERFSNFVNGGPKAYICVVMDRQVINCSKMYHLSGNVVDILPNLGSGSGLSLVDLAIFLKSGPLPMSLEVVTE
jgi:preprotein translocase subunit SecD